MYAEEIVNIEYLGMKETYDIEIDSEDHIFYGNGIATSNSHSYEYGLMGYWTAYAKYHFPLHFYAGYLAFSKEKMNSQEEIRELVEDAKFSGYEIIPPHINNLRESGGNVSIQDGKILFGIIDIKNVGMKNLEKISENITEIENKISKKINNWTWEDLLFNIDANSTVMNNLILVGATCGGKPRKQKSYEYSLYNSLTEREKEWFKNNYSNYENFQSALEAYSHIERKNGGPSTEKRRIVVKDFSKSLLNSPFSVKDDPSWIVANERNLIGVSLSYSLTETKPLAETNTCIDFLNGKDDKGKADLIVEITNVKETTVKNGPNTGQPMANITVKDNTESISAAVFSKAFAEYQEFIFEGNLVLIKGFRDKKNQNTLIVNEVKQL